MKNMVKSLAAALLVLALMLSVTGGAAAATQERQPVRAEVTLETTTVESGRQKTTKSNLWKLVIVAVCVGALAAGYGVGDMLIRKRKMDKMMTRVRLEKTLVPKDTADREPAKPKGVPKLDLSDLETAEESDEHE